MDKVTLNNGQLKELVRFIHSRGFHEPLMVMEILDHFACVVEEMIQADKGLSLQDAMQKAHKSFGITGFRHIADTLAAERQKRFNKHIRKNLKSILLSPVAWPIMIMGSILYYYLYQLIAPIDLGILPGRYLLAWTYILLLFISVGLIYRNEPYRKFRRASGTVSINSNGYSWWVYFLVMFIPAYPGKGLPVWPFATFATVITVFFVVYLVAQYRTVMTMAETYNEKLDSYNMFDIA